jgi:sulfur relay (sulfurtransferase) DsrF/TusC family protein
MKKAVVLIRSAPYGEAASAEGFRVVMALPALGVETTAVVMDDGVLCLIREADPTRIGWRGNLADAFAQTKEYEARLVVHRPSLDSRHLSERQIIDHDGYVDDAGLKSLVDEAHVVLAF